MCKAFYVYDFKDLKTDKGTPVKDLRDFLQINGDDFEEDREVRYPLSYFLELISNPATSNRLKTSIEQHSLWEEDTITIELNYRRRSVIHGSISSRSLTSRYAGVYI